jgi:hypothetical protein
MWEEGEEYCGQILWKIKALFLNPDDKNKFKCSVH